MKLLNRLLSISVLLIATLFASCHHDDPADDPEPLTNVHRTVLVYQVAQNSLGVAAYQRADSVEMMKAYKDVPANGRLLLFIDDANNPRIYQIDATTSEPRLVRQWATDEVSTSPTFFRSVLEWVQQFSPSDEYGLVMWSHATGWPTVKERTVARLKSFGIDDGRSMGTDTGTELDIDDMASAMEAANLHARFVFFDCCLMGGVEVAYALRNVTDYIIASPTPTPANGANYTHLIQSGLFSEAPDDIARTYLADVSDPLQKSDYSDYGLVISSVRTAALPNLAEAFQQALPHSTAAGAESVDMTGVLAYQTYSSNYYYRPHNYDALQALSRLFSGDDLQRVSAALNATLSFKGTTGRFWAGPGSWTYRDVDTTNYCALSLFVPQTIYSTNATERLNIYGDLNALFQRTAWYKDAGWAATGW